MRNLNLLDLQEKVKLYQEQVRTNDPILAGKLEIKKGYKVNKVECEKASSKDKNDYISM